MAIEDKSFKTNGYKIRSWGDLAALATVVSVLLALFIGVLLWGLKVEGELNVERNINRANTARIAKLEGIIERGILPRADEQNKNQDRQLNELRRELREHDH